MSNYSDQIRNAGLMETYWDNYVSEQEEIEERYQKQLRKYQEHVNTLKLEKEAFIKDNPDFPNPDILFLNVMAPPQRLELRRIL